MSKTCAISFSALDTPAAGTAVLLCGEDAALGPLARGLDKATNGAVGKAVKAAGFKGKSGSHVELWAPAGVRLERIVLIGLGKQAEFKEGDWVGLGGAIYKRVSSSSGKPVSVLAETGGSDGGPVAAAQAAQMALGLVLASYRFDKYKTKKKDDGDKKAPVKVGIAVKDAAAARRSFASLSKVAEGTLLARDLVNEPANMLGPVEFAREAKKLEKLGVEVEILTETQMRRLKMLALLGVAQGSARPPRLAVMRWNGAKAKSAKPVVFVGKGVVFDTGGISMKPAAGMEDMKGDMGGAACVTGLMHALAARKAKVNAIGVIGLVENMPDGKAQRPGDIVTSMSGQTIEILNTDAEGRLVLADALTYVQTKFKPRLIVDLATLTGAIIVALGQHHAGLFSNDDELSAQLSRAGEATGEKVWRMPLGKEYDKMIDSKNADMKNIGGRHGGSITAAQFLKRFVDDVPWAHLDIAGTAMGAPQNDINRSWGSGYGVRLLDRLVADNYEG